MPVVVKKTCDQTIVEVYTCPAPDGAGAPYIGVNVGAGSEVYKLTDQVAYPREHHFRTLVGVDGTDVTQVGDEIHISGGGQFAVDNVGAGAEVHKDTVDVLGIQTARLRSFISSSGTVQITEYPDEIDLGVAGSSFSAFPDTILASTATEICSNRVGATPVTLNYTPAVDTPEAVEGHFALFIAYYQSNLIPDDGNTTTTGLTGWTLLIGPGSHMFMVWYKWLTLADLNTTHTVTLDNTACYKGCRVVYVYQNINTEAPFYSFTSDYWLHGNRRSNKTWSTMGMATPSAAFSNGQHALTITHSRDYNQGTRVWSDMGLIPLGETQDWTDLQVVEKSFPYLTGDSPCMQFRIVGRKANVSMDENLIPGETQLSSMQHGSWATSGVLVTRPNTYLTAVQGTGAGVIKHYTEQTLSLTAGEKVTFYVWFREDGSYPNAVIKAHMYIVDPSNNERGVWLTKDGTPRNLYVSGYIDTLSDRLSVWRHCAYKCDNDGNPSLDGMVLALYITAPTTGDYKFRFGPAYGANGTSTSFTAAGGIGSTVYVSHAGIRKGYHSARRIWTPDGPVSGSASSGMIDNPGYLMDSSVNGTTPFESQQLTIVLNPTWAKYPKARISPDLANVDSTGQGVYVTNDSYTVPNKNVELGDDQTHFYATEKYVHPMQGGIVGKYYWEARCDVVTDPGWYSYQAVGIAPPFSGWASDWNTNSYPGIFYDKWLNGDGGLVVNDVIGVAMDFDVGEVKFYVNNVLKKTQAFNKNVPWCAYVMAPPAYNRPQGQWTVRLMEPFTYTPPTGFVEYDITGSPDFNFGTNTLNVGGGAEIVIPGSPDMYRTLLSGDGISVTQEETAIRIAQNIPQLPLIGNGIADGTTDTIAIFDSSAGVHKRITPQQLVDAAVISGGGSGGGSGGVTAIDAPPATPEAQDDEFNGLALDGAKWTWRNQGTATATVAGGVLMLTGAATSSSPITRGLQILEQTISGDFKYRAKLALRGGADYNNGGLVLVENSTGKCVRYCYGYGFSSTGQLYLCVEVYTSVTGPASGAPYLSGAFTAQSPFTGTLWKYFEIERAGAMLYYRVSETGAEGSFITVYSVVQTTHFTTAPDRIGLYVESISSTQAQLFCEWFRKIGASYKPGTYSVNGSGGGSGYYEVTDAPPASPNAMDAEFNTLEATNGGWGTLWTPKNGVPSQAIQASSCLIINAGNIGWQSQPISGSAWKFRAKMMWTRLVSNVNQCSVLWVGNAADTKQLDGGFWKDGAGNNYWAGNRWNSYGWVTRIGSTGLNYWEEIENWFYLEMEYDGTNIYWRRSRTGINGSFWTFLTEAQASHLASTPAFVGINVTRSENAVLIDWFRRIS